MTEPKRTDLSVHLERAILVAVLLPDGGADQVEPLTELRALARTAGAEVVGEMIQKRRVPDAAAYIGRGKARELAMLVRSLNGEVVIFDNDLSPAQIRNLEQIVGVKVLDRSELILDIFATRARTHEARLQVELAQLEYTYPRLRHMWSHLERIAGGVATSGPTAGGIGTRGPGEKQIEIDRRLVQRRKAELRRELARIDARKVREVQARSDRFNVSLVGYTNAGKSTLLNTLTGAGAFVEDKLFATLDTKTRKWDLGEGKEVLLSDTVGFVRNLPHHLIASFKATLEEAVHADLLLHVVDSAHPQALMQAEAVQKVLDELGCSDTPQILLLNKTDLPEAAERAAMLRTLFPQALPISARTGQGLDKLTEAVLKHLLENATRITIRAAAGNGKLLHMLYTHGRIHAIRFENHQMVIEVSLPKDKLPPIQRCGGEVQIQPN